MNMAGPNRAVGKPCDERIAETTTKPGCDPRWRCEQIVARSLALS
jgi:hypothetical protein